MKPKLLITIPCFNEELILEKNMAKVLDFARANLGAYDWTIQIIDNASTDRTYEIAKKLEASTPNMCVAQCPISGRGAALTHVWRDTHGYDMYSYFDIDLATDLKDFPVLLTSVQQGDHIVVGSRYVPGALIQRSFKREFLSRVYNKLLSIFFKVRFKDAQCGFKAFHGQTLPVLLSHVKDHGWFWDTEIMIHAQNAGYSVREIPVSWHEVRDEIRQSKVTPFREVMRQLKNIAKLKLRLLLNGR